MHEAAATYLSIKMGAPETQPDMLTSLDTEYHHFYSILADVLDRHLGSSYLQYLVAWNVVGASFSSRYLERFSADPTAAGLQPETEEQPNARLSMILDPLRMYFDRLLSIIDNRFRELCERYSIAYWDPHQESGWVSMGQQAPSALTQIEAQLTLVLRPFLIELGGVPVLLDNEHRRAFESLSGWLRLAQADVARMTDYDRRAHDDRAAKTSDAYNEAGSEVRVANASPLARKPGVEDWNLADDSSSFLFIEDESSAGGLGLIGRTS